MKDEVFEKTVSDLGIDEDYVKNKSPEQLIEAVGKVMEIFTKKISEVKGEYKQQANQTKQFAAKLAYLSMQFGKWSNSFNKHLFKRIKSCNKIEIPSKKAEAKKLALVYLYWTKNKQLFILCIYNSMDMFVLEKTTLVTELDNVRKEMEQTKISDYVEDI